METVNIWALGRSSLLLLRRTRDPSSCAATGTDTDTLSIWSASYMVRNAFPRVYHLSSTCWQTDSCFKSHLLLLHCRTFIAISDTCSMVPQPFSLRLLCAKHGWMAVSKVAVVHFQRILSYFGPNDSLLQRIIRGEKPGGRRQHLGDGEQCNSLWGHTWHQTCLLKKAAQEGDSDFFQSHLGGKLWWTSRGWQTDWATLLKNKQTNKKTNKKFQNNAALF